MIQRLTYPQVMLNYVQVPQCCEEKYCEKCKSVRALF